MTKWEVNDYMARALEAARAAAARVSNLDCI